MDISHFGDRSDYCNPFNSKRLGSLMGGSSVSSGKCTSTKINRLLVQVSGSDGQLIAKTKSNMKLLPGTYNVTAWPDNNRPLAQTLKGVKITAGGVLQKELEFRWPENNK